MLIGKCESRKPNSQMTFKHLAKKGINYVFKIILTEMLFTKSPYMYLIIQLMVSRLKTHVIKIITRLVIDQKLVVFKFKKFSPLQILNTHYFS